MYKRQELQAHHGVRGAESLIDVLLKPGQFLDLLMAIQDINGFSDDINEMCIRDRDRAISSGLTLAIAQDQASLNMASNGDSKAYLQMKYPNAVRTKKSGDIALNNPYRGIADILNGMSGGKEWYGFGHSKKYWKTPGNLEAEAWAQFGREYFDNAPDVKEMFEELFPNLNSHAMMALKGLIWYVERSCYRRTPGSFSPVCE